MLPYLLRIGNFMLPTYGVMAAVGLIAGLLVLARYARWQRLDPEKTWNLGIIAVLSAILGAKLLFVINNFAFYQANPRALFTLATLQTGGVWYGGLMAAIAMCLLYGLQNHLPVLKTADVFAPAIAVGHAFGRIGCLAAGCCYGRPANLPWAVKFTNPVANQLVGTPLGTYLHPTQVYEAVVEFGNFFLLSWLLRHQRFPGQVAGSYLFLYGTARYFIEFFRGDPGRGSSFFGGGISNTQLISIFLVIGGACLWLRRSPQTITAS